MIKHTFKLLLVVVALVYVPFVKAQEDDRIVWIGAMTRIADPVLINLSQNTLKKNMPYESLSKTRSKFSHLEAVGRLICGIAPWLELGPDNTPEGQLRAKYIDLAVRGLRNAVDPSAPDYLVFGEPSQPLVDAAFLAQGLLRAPKQLWEKLDDQTQKRMITELKRSRGIKPGENNWLLFASMVEAALLEFTGECDMGRLTYGVFKFRDQWYKGDAIYGDGKFFHMDYYNSFVIHPMLLDILEIMQKHNKGETDLYKKEQLRFSRYAEQQERMISPDGAYPVIGRSIAYRFGTFHVLSTAALNDLLPTTITKSQVRCGLTAVIKRHMAIKGNFDEHGWLTLGFAGHQPSIAERYISTGSLYLCSTVFTALGLPATDEFWSAPYAEWTGKKIWSGNPNVKLDKAIKL